MEIIRRNTDYGLRIMVMLAKHCGNGKLLSASQLARQGNISYEVSRKLLRRFRETKLVKSVRGSKGGFKLNRKPSEISLKTIINVLQDQIYLNACMTDGQRCEFQPECEISAKLACLQEILCDYLEAVTLNTILKSKKNKNIN